MKQIKIERNSPKKALVVATSLLVIAAVAGLATGYSKLRELWLEQCVIKDMSAQITITTGKMVPADTLAENLGIKLGANLALIDFEEKRADVLRRIPNIKSISITRKLPDKVTVLTEERSPIAQLNLRGRKAATGKVVDSEGVVFLHQHGTRLLPVIRETKAPGTPCGNRLSGPAFAALQIIDACRDPEFQGLGILEIDISHPGYLLATLGDYSFAKIAWQNMGENSDSARQHMVRQLSLLSKTIQSRIGEGTTIWNATDTSGIGYIYADRKGNL